MSIKYTAVVARSFMEGIQFIGDRIPDKEIAEIRYQSGYVRLKTGQTYQVITTVGQAQAYEFVDMVVDPRYKDLITEVKERVRE